MAVTMAEIQHLRKMTGAGMMDCKNALNEANGNFDKAVEIIRKKGQAVAAKIAEAFDNGIQRLYEKSVSKATGIASSSKGKYSPIGNACKPRDPQSLEACR